MSTNVPAGQRVHFNPSTRNVFPQRNSGVKKPFLNFSADKSKLNPYVVVRWVEEIQVLIQKDYGEMAKIFEIVNPSYPIIVRTNVPEDITDPDEQAIVRKQNLKSYISRLEQLNEIKKKVWSEVMDTLRDNSKTKVSAMVGFEDDRNEYNVLSLVKNVIWVDFARGFTDTIRDIDLIEQELHNIHQENDVDVAKYKKRWDACVLAVQSVGGHVPPQEHVAERYISRLNCTPSRSTKERRRWKQLKGGPASSPPHERTMFLNALMASLNTGPSTESMVTEIRPQIQYWGTR